MVYSSVASFYVPFIVTLLVYAQICVVLRRRGRRTAPPRRPAQKTCPLAPQAPPTQQRVSQPEDTQRKVKKLMANANIANNSLVITSWKGRIPLLHPACLPRVTKIHFVTQRLYTSLCICKDLQPALSLA